MNTAHTPQALSLPHLQIAEASARRQDENAAFERAAARLRPAWMRTEHAAQAEVRAPVLAEAPAPAPAVSLRKTLRKHAVARANAEADQYRRQMLRDLDRSQRNLRRWFIAGFVVACAALALSEARAPAPARARPHASAAAVSPASATGSEQVPARPVQAARAKPTR